MGRAGPAAIGGSSLMLNSFSGGSLFTMCRDGQRDKLLIRGGARVARTVPGESPSRERGAETLPEFRQGTEPGAASLSGIVRE